MTSLVSNKKGKHSVKVPRLYKVAASIYKDHVEGKGGIKTLIYEARKKHPNVKALLSLVSECVNRHRSIKAILDESKLLEEEPRFDPALARILITELLWGKGILPGNSLPIETLLKREKTLKSLKKASGNSEEETVLKPRYVRVNLCSTTMKVALDYLTEIDGFREIEYKEDIPYEEYLDLIRNLSEDEFITDQHVPDLLIFHPKIAFYDHQFYLEGKFILQDKASCLPVRALELEEGSVVLDACAAPGMKTTQIAAAVGPSGRVYAVEMNEKRYKTLKDMLSYTGIRASSVKPVKADFLELNPEDYPDVQYIVLDPSCSGSGTLQQDDIPDARLKKLSSFQCKMLKHAMSFPSVLKISYSTCSLYEAENEVVIEDCLKRTCQFKVAKCLKTWKNRGAKGFESSDKYIRATLKTDLCSGFFVAVLKQKK